MTTVLSACVRNAGRSPMAEAVLNALADPGEARAVGGDQAPAGAVAVRFQLRLTVGQA